MVIPDFDVVSIPVFPGEAYAVLIVDADAALSRALLRDSSAFPGELVRRVSGAARFLTSSSSSCKSRVQAKKRRINGRGCLTEAVRIDPRRTTWLAIPIRAGTRAHRHSGGGFGHSRTAPRMPHRNCPAHLLGAHHLAAFRAGRRHRPPVSQRAGGCRGYLLSPLRRRCRRATGAPALGALLPQRRTRP